MLVACLTSLVALNGKNHAGTGNSAAFTVTQPLERAQNDAFGPPNGGFTGSKNESCATTLNGAARRGPAGALCPVSVRTTGLSAAVRHRYAHNI